jgi:tetratricopeptide (TPR) repeat protein
MRIRVLYTLVVPVLSAVVLLAIAAPSECQTDESSRTQALRHQNAGFELARHGRPSEAIAEYEAGMALDPNVGSLYYMRSLAYIDLQDFQAALADLNRALELEPDPPQYYYQRAVVSHALGNRDQALADLETVLSMTSDPDYVHPALSLQDRIRGGD